MSKIIILSVGLGAIWVAITALNVFGWIQDGFYGGFGILAYFLYGLLVPVISGGISAVMAREQRIRLGLMAFGVTLATLLVGFGLLYISNQAKNQKVLKEEAQYETEFQRELENANEYRKQNNIQ